MNEADLALELITASMTRDDAADFIKYAYGRLDEELHTQQDAYSLIGVLATVGAESISGWAEDTDRTPAELLQTIALANASDMYTDDEE